MKRKSVDWKEKYYILADQCEDRGLRIRQCPKCDMDFFMEPEEDFPILRGCTECTTIFCSENCYQENSIRSSEIDYHYVNISFYPFLKGVIAPTRLLLTALFCHKVPDFALELVKQGAQIPESSELEKCIPFLCQLFAEFPSHDLLKSEVIINIIVLYMKTTSIEAIPFMTQFIKARAIVDSKRNPVIQHAIDNELGLQAIYKYLLSRHRYGKEWFITVDHILQDRQMLHALRSNKQLRLRDVYHKWFPSNKTRNFEPNLRELISYSMGELRHVLTAIPIEQLEHIATCKEGQNYLKESLQKSPQFYLIFQHLGSNAKNIWIQILLAGQWYSWIDFLLSPESHKERTA